jgi:hypothetical protein
LGLLIRVDATGLPDEIFAIAITDLESRRAQQLAG